MILMIWLASALFAAAGTALVLLRHGNARPRPLKGRIEGVSVLKPLCGADSGLEENLRGFFRQDYPSYELLFSVASAADPAAAVVAALQREFPGVPSRLFVGAVNAGPNPKVNNMLRAYEEARHDLLLISDSNVRVPGHYLRSVVAELRDDTGVVTAVVAGTAPEGMGAHLEATYLNTFYARGMNLAFATGNPCVIGKSMLFRRSAADRFGGIAALVGYLAEDYALGEEMRRLGLKVVLMRDTIRQHVGAYSFRAFWQRHIRWGRIRKAHAPLAFLLEPICMPLVASTLAGLALRDALGFVPGFLLNLGLWFSADLLLMGRLGGGLSVASPVYWLLRELTALPLWLAAGIGNTVNWRGRRIRIQPGGLIENTGGEECIQVSFGARQRARIRWRATIRQATGGAGSTTAI